MTISTRRAGTHKNRQSSACFWAFSSCLPCETNTINGAQRSGTSLLETRAEACCFGAACWQESALAASHCCWVTLIAYFKQHTSVVSSNSYNGLMFWLNNCERCKYIVESFSMNTLKTTQIVDQWTHTDITQSKNATLVKWCSCIWMLSNIAIH